VVIRQLWQHFGRWGRGYQEADLLAAFAAEAADLERLLPHWLEDHGDPDLAGYLADVGLKLVPKGGASAWLGLTMKAESSGLLVQRVHRHGPAEQAGLAVGDELLALDGERLRQLDGFKAGWTPGQKRELLFCRRGRIRTSHLSPAASPVEAWRLETCPAAGAPALERRRQWLSLLPA